MEDQDSFCMDKCALMDVFDEGWMTEMINSDFHISFPDEMFSSCSTPTFPHLPPQPLIIEQTETHDVPKRYTNSLTPVILNFDNGNNSSAKLKNKVKKVGKGTRVIRHRSETYDHITSERKRREQLSQKFTALSTLVPGLTKTDKTSVLTDAVEYLKQLEEKAKILEEKNRRQTIESVVLVEESYENNYCNTQHCESDDYLPEIEARYSDTSVLMKIHCEKRKGDLVKILAEIEKMNVTILNTSISPFGTSALDVTIIAEMEKEFDMTLEDFVKNLRLNVRGQICP